MDLKLYKVEISTTVLVAAKSEKEAGEIATSAVEGGDGVELNTDSVQQLTDKGQIPHDWRGSIPFQEGGSFTSVDFEMTCEQFLESV